MALKATIYKAELSVADMDRNYYETHKLTVARHPSETDERMMSRVVAFALNADERLQFTKGLSTDSEPEIWQKSLSDEIEIWIELGLPSDKRIRQASNKADRCLIYAYGGRTAEIWWDKIKADVARFQNVEVYNFKHEATEALVQMVARTMQIQVNIQDGEVSVSDGEHSVHMIPEKWQ